MPRISTALIAGTLWLAAALPAQAIVGGIATDAAFFHVGAGVWADPSRTGKASAVQITDNWVLTARHVGYTVGDSFVGGYGGAAIAARYVLGTGPTLVNDLALLRLATAVVAPPLQLLADLLPFGALTPPLPATIATGSNQLPRGYAWAGIAEVVDQVELEVGGVVGDYPVNWLQVYDAGHGAPYVQGGDSGGGLFLGHVPDSTGAALMGITSARLEFGAAEGGGFGSGFVQLAAYRSWIDGTMADDLTDSQLARWVSVVPEPASWALALAGGALLAGIARRRRG